MNERIYIAVRTAFINGLISEMDWIDYCTRILYSIMEENKDVFIRLKEV